MKRLMGLSEGRADEGSPLKGCDHEKDTPIVVPLTATLRNHVKEYLELNKRRLYDVQSTTAQFPIWYGVCEGYHFNLFVRVLNSSKPSWSSYLGFVTILKGGHPLQHY